MSSWSSRRKSIYALTIVILLVVLIGVPAFNLFYEAPSCTDGKKNGDEKGVDCGGSCTKLCSNSFLDIPSASWVRYKESAPGVYNIAAYIVNPNPKAGADNLPYRFVVLDRDGLPLTESKGVFNLPPGRNTVIFKTGLVIKDQPPARAIVEFPRQPEWIPGSDSLSALAVTDKEYAEGFASSLDVKLRNGSPFPMRDVIVYAILKDKDGNVVDFSKTIVDEVKPMGTALAPFTWPWSHEGKVISIEVLAVPE